MIVAEDKLRIIGQEVKEVEVEPDHVGHYREFKIIVFVLREMDINAGILRVKRSEFPFKNITLAIVFRIKYKKPWWETS